MIFDAIENAKKYSGLGEKFKMAFNFLLTTEFDSATDPKIEIDGDNIFALVQTYETRSQEYARWEKHEKYVDIQYMVSGTENIGFVLSDYLEVLEDYNDETDVEFLEGDGDFLQLNSGEFVIFFPDDAHMPGLAVETKEKVYKVVVKIKI